MVDDGLIIPRSLRTFRRDLKEIRIIFGIDIEYSTQMKGYSIVSTEAENMNFLRMIEAYDMFNSLNPVQDVGHFVHLEQRRSQGTESICRGLLHAIKNHLRIEFSYHKYWEDEVSQRLAHPYGLKEFRNRWYVLAEDSGDEIVKSFALDRISDLLITKTTFLPSPHYNIKAAYEYCFGIISPNDEQPVEIVLSFDPFQGKYIKSLPLHHTQVVTVDTDAELRVTLRLCITQDLVMELLSFGASMKVLAPQSLVDEILSAYKEALGRY